MKKKSHEIVGFNVYDFTELVQDWPDSGKLVEIGPFRGRSTVAWAEAFEAAGKDWKIHTIELFYGASNVNRPQDTSEEFHNFLDTLMCSPEEQKADFIRNIEGWDNITWEENYFTEEYKQDGTVDAVFYDGMLQYESVLTALEYWKQYCNGSIIVMHNPDNYPGIQNAVDEVFSVDQFKIYKDRKNAEGHDAFPFIEILNSAT